MNVSAVLDTAVSQTSTAFPIPGPQPWSWQTRAGALDLHAGPAYRRDGADPDSRLTAIACGVALHRALIVFTALGLRGVIRPGTEGDLFATVAPAGLHTATAHDLALHEALLRGSVLEPALHHGDATLLISQAVRPYEVSVYTFDANTARFLDAMAHHALQDALRLALVTSGDAASDWVRAGQALSSALLTAAVAGLAVRIDDLAEAPGTRALLRSLAEPAGQPQILIRIAAAA